MRAVTVLIDDEGSRRVIHTSGLEIAEVTELLHLGLAMTAEVAMREIRSES